jgi:hypothetical protein
MDIDTLKTVIQITTGAAAIFAGTYRFVLKPAARKVKTFAADVRDGLTDVQHIKAEMYPNGGGSLRDAVNRTEKRVDAIEGRVKAVENTQGLLMDAITTPDRHAQPRT